MSSHDRASKCAQDGGSASGWTAMTTRPPRATTKGGDGKRPRARGATLGEKLDKPDKPERPDRLERSERPERSDRLERPDRPERSDRPERPDQLERPDRPERSDQPRSPSIVSTDQYVRVSDDEIVEIVEVADPPEVPRLRMLVLESVPHLASAQLAIAEAGHLVVASASGRDGLDKLRAGVGEVDALLVGLPGSEPLIEAVLALGPIRPVVISASTSSALEAVRRAAASGADLAAVRPHDVERLAPILLAAARLVVQRRELRSAQAAVAELAGGQDEPGGRGEPDELSASDPGLLQPFEAFQQAVELELERARRYAYPLAIAMFGVDIAPPEPPPGVRGILRARAGNALVNAIRDVDLVTELDQDRFLVLLPYTDRLVGAEVARGIIGAVAAADPVIAAGRTFPPKVIGAVAGIRPGEPVSFAQLIQDATQLLEQAAVTGASLAVEP
jgi:DNA-binding NarL/FixJ family response regulator